jgi:glutamate formiminotransferase
LGLECVINVSCSGPEVAPIAAAGGPALLDVHQDAHHNRSVLTLAGPSVAAAADNVARAAIAVIDLSTHRGVHPRIGAVDVVPFVDLADPWAPATASSLQARDRFADFAAGLGLPVYLYGPERPLPSLRRDVAAGRPPDVGPTTPHPTAGRVAVGARGVLVAYNVWVAASLADARAVAAALRGPALRTLGLQVGDGVQVSCNLVAPRLVNVDAVYDLVAARLPVDGAELVGLLPHALLESIPRRRWAQLDLSEDRTIEARLEAVRSR